MLETIREFAGERLAEPGEAEAVRRRHAEHFLALAEEAYPYLTGSPKEWLERLEAEHDNLRAALDCLEASGEGELDLRLAGALWRFWSMRGHQAEGRRRLESALRTDERPTAARARALNGASALAVGGGGDVATARLRAEEALALNRQLGDALGTANSDLLLGLAVAGEGDMARAQQLFDESVRAFRELGDEHFTLVATRALAWAYDELGDRERARALHEEVVRQASALGNERMEARSLGSLGAILGEESRLEESLPLLKEAYRIDRDLGDRLEIALDLGRFAVALAVGGRAGTAARLLSRSEALRDEIGATFPAWGVRQNERALRAIHAQLDEVAFAEAWEQGQALTADEAVALALGEAERDV